MPKYHIIEEGWNIDHYIVEAKDLAEAIHKVSIAPEIGLEPEMSDFSGTQIKEGSLD